jgi:excisionase family DNA binding protein
MEELLTVQEVAKILKVHPKTVKSYIDAGELKASWLGNRWRIKTKSVEGFVDERERIL